MKAGVHAWGLAVLLAGTVSRGDSTATHYPTGLIPLAEEIRQGLAPDIDWIRGVADLKKLGRAPRALPSSCANTLYLPAVRSQLLSNCGAYAPSYYYKTYQEAREHGWPHPNPDVNPERVMSPGFTFPLTNRGENNGAGLGTVMGVICRYGIATWKDMPESATWWEYPADGVWEKALPYRGDRVIGFSLATDDGMQAMKQHLADGDLGVFAVPVSTTLTGYPLGGSVDNDVLYDNGEIYSSHALTLIGYDDAKTYNDGTGTKTGAFLAVNSWGGWGVVEPSVGTGGFCWLSYDYMRTRRMGDSSVLAMVDRTNYVPREVAEIEVGHEVRNELQLEIAPGNGPWSTNGLEAFPRGGGPLQYYGTITVDVTDFMADRPDVYHLFAMDWLSAQVGTIRRFAVRKANGMEMECPDAPATLENSVPEEYPNWHPARLAVGTLQQEGMSVWTEDLQTPAFAWVDFDQDGDSDFAVFGVNSTNYHSGVYFNDGDGHFAKGSSSLPWLSSARLAWGDYDRDGYPDLAVSGRTPAFAPTTLLLRNQAGSALVDSGISLPPAETGLAWGDYDQDGDEDLATSAGKLLRNDGGTNFVDTGFALVGGDTAKSVSWADLDNDGLLDLEINGKINQNLGGCFTNDPLNGPAIGSFSDVPPLWRDFNGDGLLDAAAAGRIYQNMGYVYQLGYHDPEHPEWDIPDQWRLWFNAGGVVFSNWSWPRLDAGDYDHDGDVDLAMSGAAGSSADVRCSVFRQETNQVFADIGLRLSGFYDGGVGWQDWDGDGDLDLLTAGMDSNFVPRLAAMENHLADRGAPNQPPAAPQRFQTTSSGTNVLLQWQPAEDAETPPGLLAYEARVGRYPGRSDVVSPGDSGGACGNARLIGALTLPTNPTPYQTFCNTNGLPGLRLRNLAAGRYYWSVRTVDGGRARSPWSAEQSFTVAAGGLRTGDVNGDGKVDVADLVRCRKMIAGSVPPVVGTADLNDDGTVDEPDAVILADLLLDTGAAGYVPVAEATIGSAGGALSNGQFSLAVPAGAFSESTKLKLLLAGDDRWFGASSPRLMWRIQGLPSTLSGTLTLSGPDQRAATTAAVMIALGQWIRPLGVNGGTLEPVRTFSAVTGTVSGGRWTAQVPAALLYGAGESGGGPIWAAARATNSDWKFDVDTGIFWDSYSFKTPHFKICWEGMTPAYVVSLGQELEEAFNRFQTMGYPFADKRNWTNYPVQVWLKALKDEGGEVHSSDNGAYLELNVNRLVNDELRRSTANHEVFHLVQGLVNPANSWTEAGDQHLSLVKEATATWMERFGSATPDSYVPPNYNENQLRAFQGLHYGADADADKAGYALSAMIEYLALHYGGDAAILRIFTRIAAGEDALAAVLNSVPATNYKTWYPDFYHCWVEGGVYGASPLVNISPKLSPLWPSEALTFTATSNSAALASFPVIMPKLTSEGWRFAFTADAVAKLSNTSALVFSLQNPQNDLTLNVVSAQNRADARGTISGEDYGVKPEVVRYRVPNLKAALPLPQHPNVVALRSFIALVTRADNPDPDVFAYSALKMAVVDQMNGQLSLPAFTHGSLWFNNVDVGFPTFACTAHLTANDLTGLFYSGVFQVSPGVDSGYALLKIFQDGAIPVDFSFSGVLSGASQKDVPDPGHTNSFSRFTLKSVSGYKIAKRLYGGPELEDQPYVFEPRPFSGSETLTLEEDEEKVYYLITIHFTVEYQEYEDGLPSGSPFTWEAMASPVTIHLERQ